MQGKMLAKGWRSHIDPSTLGFIQFFLCVILEDEDLGDDGDDDAGWLLAA